FLSSLSVPSWKHSRGARRVGSPERMQPRPSRASLAREADRDAVARALQRGERDAVALPRVARRRARGLAVAHRAQQLVDQRALAAAVAVGRDGELGATRAAGLVVGHLEPLLETGELAERAAVRTVDAYLTHRPVRARAHRERREDAVLERDVDGLRRWLIVLADLPRAESPARRAQRVLDRRDARVVAHRGE